MLSAACLLAHYLLPTELQPCLDHQLPCLPRGCPRRETETRTSFLQVSPAVQDRIEHRRPPFPGSFRQLDSIVSHATPICHVVWCGVVWCGVVWCGVVWCGVVWCGVVWCGVVWCGGGGGGGAPAVVPRTVSCGVVPRGPHAGSAEGVLRLTSARVRRISSHT